jgi:predicted DNA-binding protein
MLQIQLSRKNETRLDFLAGKMGRPKEYYAKQAILGMLEDMEDTNLALERLRNPGKICTQEEIETELALRGKEK